MTASKELLAKKLTAAEFLQRCTNKGKLLPSCVKDTTEKYINCDSVDDDELDNKDDDNIDDDINLTSTSSSVQHAKAQCSVCKDLPPAFMFLPCTHVTACKDCWSTIKEMLIERLQAENGEDFDYNELEQRAADDPTFSIPQNMLPKCPYCRKPVTTSIECYVP